MASWAWLLVALGAVLLLYAAFVAILAIAGRREDARALAGFIPDCAVLTARLLRDGRVPRRYKLLLAGLLAYLALPFDLVPDFIPVAGQLDDAILVAATMAYVVRRAGCEVVEELWPGSKRGLHVVLALS